MWIHLPVDAHLLPEYEGVMETYRKLHEDMQNGRVKAAYVVDRQGIAAAVSKMAFGNALGVTIEHNVDERDLFTPYIADLICEVPAEKVGELASTYTVIGEVTDKPVLSYKDTEITIREAVSAWNKPLEKVFKTVSGAELPEVDALNVAAADENGIVADSCYQAKSIHVCSHKLAQPTVFIPVFPGTNCEYDSTRAFERAGAKVITQVFSNLSAEDIRGSVDAFEKVINQAQIIMFPGGFSAGDEPDGSAKFFATAFQNAKIKEAVTKLLNERDGLALGICNGFQALIKLGLVPYGEITRTDGGFPDSDLQHYRTPYFQDGLHEGCDQQIPMAGRRRAWRCLHQPGIPRRGTFRSIERVDRQADGKRPDCNPLLRCQRKPDQRRVLECQRFLLRNRGYHQPGRPCLW